jgi:hypothetical protein
MSKHVKLPMLVAVAALGVTTPLLAQSRSAVSDAELDAVITARPAGNREAVRDFLATEQVRKAASRLGISASELSAQVGTLDQASLDQIAAQLKVGDRALAGGSSTIVISSTVIIIALLILIIILVS